MSFSDFPVFRAQACCRVTNDSAAPLLDFRAPPGQLPAKLLLTSLKLYPARTGRGTSLVSDLQAFVALQHIKERGTRTAGLPSLLEPAQTFLRPRRAVPRRRAPKSTPRAFPRTRAGFVSPRQRSWASTYRALIRPKIATRLRVASFRAVTRRAQPPRPTPKA